MMNPAYHFARMKELLDEYEPSQARDRASMYLDLCSKHLAECTPKPEALQRDQCDAR